MDKQKNKQLKNIYKQQKKNELLESLPISLPDLICLFEYLNQFDECDDTLRNTIEFLQNRNIEIENVINWLNDKGGFCDCEVINNVYDECGEIVDWCLD